MAQKQEGSSYQGKTIDDDHNLGIAAANSTEGGRCASVRDIKAAACTPGLDMESALTGVLVQMSEAQDTASSKVVVLPTYPVPYHSSSDHTHNTNPVQPVQDTCSAEAGKAGYTRMGANHPAC